MTEKLTELEQVKLRREKAKAIIDEVEAAKLKGQILTLVEYRTAVERLINGINEILYDLEKSYPDSKPHVALARKRISEIEV